MNELMPKPEQPDEGMEAVYDAWNRTVELIDEDTQNTMAIYGWDGQNRRIVKEIYDGGSLDETLHFYYTQPSPEHDKQIRCHSRHTTDYKLTMAMAVRS